LDREFGFFQLSFDEGDDCIVKLSVLSKRQVFWGDRTARKPVGGNDPLSLIDDIRHVDLTKHQVTDQST
jgi:hypothetical protein